MCFCWPESIGMDAEIGLPIWFQNHPKGFLYNPVKQDWESELVSFSRCVVWDDTLRTGHGSKVSALSVVLSSRCIHQSSSEVRHVLSVYSCRLTLYSAGRDARPLVPYLHTEQAVQVPELMFRVLFGCVTKSPLHFTDIHRCIPHVRCQLPLHPKSLNGLGLRHWASFDSSVPCGRLSRTSHEVRIPAASKTTMAPSDPSRHRGFVRLPLLYSPPPPIP